MEDPLSFEPKLEDADADAFKMSGSEEDDIGYHSIGRNIKVMAALNDLKSLLAFIFKARSCSV